MNVLHEMALWAQENQLAAFILLIIVLVSAALLFFGLQYGFDQGMTWIKNLFS